MGRGEKKNAAKYTAEDAVAALFNMKNEDGSRKYSHKSDNNNGPPPTAAYVKQLFSKRKGEGAKLYTKRNYTVEGHKEKCTELFGEKEMTEKMY